MTIIKVALLFLYSSIKQKIEKDLVDFWHRKMTLKVRIVVFFTLQNHNFEHTKNHKWRVGCRYDFTKLNFGNCSFIIRWDISEIKHAKFCLLFFFVLWNFAEILKLDGILLPHRKHVLWILSEFQFSILTNKIPTTQIQISHQNWDSFFSNTISHQMII